MVIEIYVSSNWPSGWTKLPEIVNRVTYEYARNNRLNNSYIFLIIIKILQAKPGIRHSTKHLPLNVENLRLKIKLKFLKPWLIIELNYPGLKLNLLFRLRDISVMEI